MIRYCRAFALADLVGVGELDRAVSTWDKRPDVVYLWDDNTVTALPLRGCGPEFTSDEPRWRSICGQLLADPIGQG
ncbi:hypothetical protein [Pseudonocardia sp. TRM90224]|uniref:hypothetical protein n=1 Tax=Pseudonocardia sp. TRM90224 TaxID=2812678 RepID=UPI001E3CBCA8|nr:hypothetical protein [Pseudonocardia sp. TRM90224]